MNDFHLLAFAGSVAQNAVLAQIPKLTDVYWQNQTDGMTQMKSQRVFGAYVRADSATAVRLNSPMLRIPVFPRLSYIDTAADPPNLPPVNVYYESGPMIPALDPLNVEVSRAGAGASVCQALLFTGSSSPAKITGECRTLLATSTITASTTAWTAGTLTLSDTLPAGRYRIVGAQGFGTNLLAGRIVFPDRQNRPGFLAQQAAGEYGWDWFRYGNLGSWGEFSSTALPTVEVLAYGANTSQTWHIDITKIG